MIRGISLSVENKTDENKTENKYIKMIKEYKTEIIIGTLAIGLTIGAVYIINNVGIEKVNYNKIDSSKNTLTKIVNKDKVRLIEKTVTQDIKLNTENIRPISVKMHPRNLPNGHKASPKKVATALERGIQLGTHQTWVDNYTKLAS